MTTHKAIREASALTLTGDTWESDGAGVYSVCDAGYEVAVCFTQDNDDAKFIAACNPAAIRALLADLDAKTDALKSVQAAIYMDDAGQLRLTRSFDESVIDAALKGTP